MKLSWCHSRAWAERRRAGRGGHKRWRAPRAASNGSSGKWLQRLHLRDRRPVLLCRDPMAPSVFRAGPAAAGGAVGAPCEEDRRGREGRGVQREAPARGCDALSGRAAAWATELVAMMCRNRAQAPAGFPRSSKSAEISPCVSDTRVFVSDKLRVSGTPGSRWGHAGVTLGSRWGHAGRGARRRHTPEGGARAGGVEARGGDAEDVPH